MCQIISLFIYFFFPFSILTTKFLCQEWSPWGIIKPLNLPGRRTQPTTHPVSQEGQGRDDPLLGDALEDPGCAIQAAHAGSQGGDVEAQQKEETHQRDLQEEGKQTSEGVGKEESTPCPAWPRPDQTTSLKRHRNRKPSSGRNHFSFAANWDPTQWYWLACITPARPGHCFRKRMRAHIEAQILHW